LATPSTVASDFLARHASAIIVAATLVTTLLVLPMLLLASDDVASTEPGGEVFDLRDAIDASLASTAFITAYIAEAHDGDMLRQAPLAELLRNERALLAADDAGALTPGALTPRPLLIESFHTRTKLNYRGAVSMADAVDAWLLFALGKPLAQASEDEVKLAVSDLLSNPLTSGVIDQLSVLATQERRTVLGQEIDYWVSPAIIFAVRADNVALGGATGFRGIATDETGLNLERFGRNVQKHLRGDELNFALWGLAIDQTLAATEQGETAGTFIVLTVIGALAVVGASLRAYWPTALTAAGIGVLMIWLKGFSALVGIKGGLIIELIVPIAMVSLGVDFAVHAVRRYQEERGTGLAPRPALRMGMAGVIGALLLAMLSDGIAFLSNVPSGIEAVVHFGLAAGIAVVSSFTVLGVVLPLALMRVDELRATRTLGRGWPWWVAMLAAIGVVAITGSGVILLVAVDQGIGAGVLFLGIATFIALPVAALALRRGPVGSGATDPTGAQTAPTPHLMEGAWLITLVTSLAARRAIVLPVAALVTVASVFFALRLEATFDVKDFFAEDSDLVIGLDKLGLHVGDRTGEAGTIFVRGDLTQPDTLAAIEAFTERLGDNPFVGTELDGKPSVYEANLLEMLARLTASPIGVAGVREATGVAVTDDDGDGRPDNAEQVRAAYAYMTTAGVPLDAKTTFYAADVVREAIAFDDARPTDQVTVISVGIPGTREQSVITGARAALLADIATLRGTPGLTQVGLTGSPFIRDAELTATVDNLRRSLPIAAVGALLLLLIAFRSIRYALVTIVPIGLVVVWLYAIMEVAGFALNFVSATIGAVSIGVGIDYSIHMTERFREEMGRADTRLNALRRATGGTGVALLASAGSSVVGFAIMGFAPMPMFSTYGILTALMIALALIAALAVLPSLLMVVTPEPSPAPSPTREQESD
jgi:predicted RND superfamily exporter protein